MMKFFCCVAMVICISVSGCLNTEGTLDIKGKVQDDVTKVLISNREIVVKGLIGNSGKFFSVDAGQFSTDSSGNFTHTLRKVKDAYFYNFCFVGDSAYAFSTQKLGLYEIQKNAGFLTFRLSRLAALMITVERNSKLPTPDTLYLSWISGGMDGNTLYPGRTENYGIPPDLSYRWIGGNVKSIIRTRAYADKMTVVSWVLFRGGKKKEVSNTVFCTRDNPNIVSFKY